jgi:hypothetical protein
MTRYIPVQTVLDSVAIDDRILGVAENTELVVGGAG